jgi:CelD/BcsL family acetyltransferase involved in cellulose biosynthesis
MTLTVLSVAYPLAPVGPDAVGGAEQILSQLDRALAADGHRSLVIACEGSQTAGVLISTGPVPGELSKDVRRAARFRTLEALRGALQDRRIDVIHVHGVDFWSYLPETDVPILATLHLPPSWYPAEIFQPQENLFMHCVSVDQRESCPAAARLLPDIPNGVSIAGDLEPKECYALSMGRICPEKGFHVAAEAARLAGVPFILAGEVFGYEAHRSYFERQLRPLLQGDASFTGPVYGERKRLLLARARCVLVPSLVPETSSLVALEAMAAGTPVIAFPSGALRGLVQHGKTGFLAGSAAEMADAIGRVGEISPADCREYAAEHYSLERMTGRYLDVYRTLRGVERRSYTIPARKPEVRLEGFETIVPEWRRLFQASAHATPFQSPDWLQPWWDCCGSGDPTIVTIRYRGELIGLAPLYIAGGTVRFLGSSISDYGDAIAAPAWDQIVADSVIDALSSLESQWTLCDLDELRLTSPLLLARMPARYQVTVAASSICPQVDLRESHLSRKARRNLDSARRRLEQEFRDVRFETLRDDDAGNFVEEFVRLHEARWRERDQPGVLADAAVKNFHRAAIPRLQRQGLARLHVLRSGDRTLSVLYCLAHAQTLYYYLGGFDPSVGRLGPGSLLIDYAMDQARREGLETMDFLRGAECYKYVWGAVDSRNRRLQIRR